MLLVNGPQVAVGYWRRDEETAARFRDGWIVTGDLVRVDEAGVFQHVGRVDEVVTRDGGARLPATGRGRARATPRGCTARAWSPRGSCCSPRWSRPAAPDRTPTRCWHTVVRLLIVDNYDSFTYNLAQELGELGADVEVVRNDAFTVDDLWPTCPTAS
jgi:hypothetical protein